MNLGTELCLIPSLRLISLFELWQLPLPVINHYNIEHEKLPAGFSSEQAKNGKNFTLACSGVSLNISIFSMLALRIRLPCLVSDVSKSFIFLKLKKKILGEVCSFLCHEKHNSIHYTL